MASVILRKDAENAFDDEVPELTILTQVVTMDFYFWIDCSNSLHN